MISGSHLVPYLMAAIVRTQACIRREQLERRAAHQADPADAARESPGEPDWRHRERLARAARRAGVVE